MILPAIVAAAAGLAERDPVDPAHLGLGVSFLRELFDPAVGALSTLPDGKHPERPAGAEQGHREVGSYAIGKVAALYAVGPLMAHAVKAFGADGRHFADQASLIEALRAEQGHTTILIKGSRSAAMEKVVAALCGTSGESH